MNVSLACATELERALELVALELAAREAELAQSQAERGVPGWVGYNDVGVKGLASGVQCEQTS